MINISCNNCQLDIVGKGFRTHCQHIYCQQCARDVVFSSRCCPFCESLIKDTDLIEVDIGREQRNSILPTISNQVFSARNWFDAINEIQIIESFLSSLSLLSNKQLAIGCSGLDNRSKKMEKVLEEKVISSENLLHDFQSQLARIEQRSRSLEQEIANKDDEIKDYGFQLQEKARKCQAWEKAYESLKKQIQHHGKIDTPNLIPRDEEMFTERKEFVDKRSGDSFPRTFFPQHTKDGNIPGYNERSCFRPISTSSLDKTHQDSFFEPRENKRSRFFSDI